MSLSKELSRIEILRILAIYKDLPCSREFLGIVSHGKSDAKNFFLDLRKAEKQRNDSLQCINGFHSNVIKL